MLENIVSGTELAYFFERIMRPAQFRLTFFCSPLVKELKSIRRHLARTLHPRDLSAIYLFSSIPTLSARQQQIQGDNPNAPDPNSGDY